MILILTKQDGEVTSEVVIDWIEHLGGECIRFNGEEIDGINPYQLNFGSGSSEWTFTYQGKQYTDKDIHVAWHRRYHSFSSINALPAHDYESLRLSNQVKKYLKSELKGVANTIHFLLCDKFVIDHPDKLVPNKLECLFFAQEVGLHIPDSMITNNREDFEGFLEKHPTVITKAVTDGTFFKSAGTYFPMYTSKITAENKHLVDETFFPSLIQAYLEKEYELRVYYFDGKCYSMAIFSQGNAKTEVDFRNYDRETPNRTVPYQLPEEQSTKITAFMKKVGLKSGSIDMIKTPEGKYIFLEVNPVGQFGMVSFPCNYYLEKKLAQYLVEKDREYAENK